MNVAPPDDRELRARVRAALEREAAEHPAPSFAGVHAAARRRNAARVATGHGVDRGAAGERRTLAYAAAAAAVAVVALTVLLVRPPASDRDGGAASARIADAASDADYAAAVALRERVRHGTPLDPLLASLPDTVARGLPAMPEYRYPLLPADAPLGAEDTTRNPS